MKSLLTRRDHDDIIQSLVDIHESVEFRKVDGDLSYVACLGAAQPLHPQRRNDH